MKREFTWPLIFFFLCRYCLLGSLIGLIISLTIRNPVNCQALYIFNSWAGNMTILCASTCLMLRTIAIWERKLKIVIPLCLLCLAHWVLLWRGMFILKTEYSPSQDACVLISNNHVFLNVTFFMTMGFDLTILVFTMAALVPKKTRSDLWTLLFRDGLVYFIITFCFNALPAILNVINLNVSMDVVATVPAATFSAIAACRAVMRLQQFSHSDVYVHTASQVTGAAARRFTGAPARRSFVFARPEVHVTTDHFVMEDFVTTPSSDGTKVNLSRTPSADDKDFLHEGKRHFIAPSTGVAA